MNRVHQEVYDFFTDDPVSVAELHQGVVRWVTRESTPGQSDAHMISILQDAHKRFGFTDNFNPHSFIPSNTSGAITGNLKWAVRILETGGHFDAEYFDWLKENITAWLLETPQDQNLYLVYPIQSRVCRSTQYGSTNQQNLSDDDFEILRKLLHFWFGVQVSRFRITVVSTSDQKSDRGIETQTGMRLSGNLGGRPQKEFVETFESPPIPNRKQLYAEVRELVAAHGWNAGQVHRYILDKYNIGLPLRTLQRLLKKLGKSHKPGRPSRHHIRNGRREHSAGSAIEKTGHFHSVNNTPLFQEHYG